MRVKIQIPYIQTGFNGLWNVTDLRVLTLESEDMPDTIMLRSLRFEVDGKLFAVLPLYWHPDSRAIHTICKRNSPEIEQVEL